MKPSRLVDIFALVSFAPPVQRSAAQIDTHLLDREVPVIIAVGSKQARHAARGAQGLPVRFIRDKKEPIHARPAWSAAPTHDEQRGKMHPQRGLNGAQDAGVPRAR